MEYGVSRIFFIIVIEASAYAAVDYLSSMPKIQ